MAKYIDAVTAAEGWVTALEYLLQSGGQETQLIVSIKEPLKDNLLVQARVDRFLADRHGEDSQGTDTVANTIFPVSLSTRTGLEGREWLYSAYNRLWEIIRKHPANNRGTYFRRLTAYPGEEKSSNQIEHVILRMQSELLRPNPKHATYELSIRVAEKDRAIMGFPCLSHISLTLVDKHLNLTAIYRNQHFARKAFGNYLGLSRLLAFISRETGVEVGQVVCVASHADAEISTYNKRSLQELTADVRSLLNKNTTPSEGEI